MFDRIETHETPKENVPTNQLFRVAPVLRNAFAYVPRLPVARADIGSLFLPACHCAPAHPYRTEYRRQMFSRRAIPSVLGGAAVRQWRNNPRQWGGGATGFGMRVASAAGKHVIKRSIEFAVAAARHEDLHYYRSNQRGFGPRLRHGLIASAWEPAGFSMAGGLASGGISPGAETGGNVAREFWPRPKHKISRTVREKRSRQSAPQ